METRKDGPQLSEEITLDVPVERGTEKIEKVRIRKPQAGELRGLNLRELIDQDVDQVRKALPRVTVPSLTAHEIDQLDPADLLHMGGELALFFLKKADRPASLKG